MADENLNEANNARRDEAELIGRIIQSEQKLSDYFTTIITNSVTDQLERRSIIRLRVIGMVIALLVTVAIPGIMSWTRGTIAKQTEQVLTVQFEKSTVEIERRFTAFLEKERTYASLSSYLLYLSERNTVRDSELIEVRVRLEQLGADPEIRSRPGFSRMLDLVARLAVYHGDLATLELLEAEFTDQLMMSRTRPRLARFYGERVLGGIFTSEAQGSAAARRFQRHLDASESSSYFAAILPLQAMVNAQINLAESERAFEGVQLLVESLGPLDQATFIAETVRYSNPEFREVSPTPQSRRIAIAAGELVINHRNFYIQLLDNISVQTALIDIANSEANKGNASFATALSGFRNAFSSELESTDGAEFHAAIDVLIHSDIGLLMEDKMVVDAIRQQNLETKDFSQVRIDELEAEWNDEFQSGVYNLIKGVLDQPLSRFLRRAKRNSEDTYLKLIVMDGAGLLVGSSDPNSDYWQGDEDKWLKTYKAGPGTLHIGPLEFDESSLSWVIEISMPIPDPETGQPIGAWTAAICPSMLEDML